MTAPRRRWSFSRTLLLPESQIDRIVRYRRILMVVGLAALLFGYSSFSGFMVLSLGIYGVAFQRWRSDPGLWMLAALVTIGMAPCFVYFQYEHLQGLLAPADANQARRAATWKEACHAIDIALSLYLLLVVLRLAATVTIVNWKITRVINRFRKLARGQSEAVY